MSAPICLYCGYSRAVAVAGCEHATLPAESDGCPHKDCPRCEGRGWVNTVGSTCLACCGPVRVGAVITVGEEMASAFRAMEPLRCVPSPAVTIREALRSTGCPSDCGADWHSDGCPRGALATMEAQDALLAGELVDLHRQVVAQHETLAAAQRELEQERRDNGRLRADNEQLREMLDDAPANPADLCAACGHHRNDHAQQEGEDEPTCGALADVPVADCDCAGWRAP